MENNSFFLPRDGVQPWEGGSANAVEKFLKKFYCESKHVKRGGAGIDDQFDDFLSKCENLSKRHT